MAAGPWTLYDQFLLSLGKKVIDLNADSFKVALFTSASIAINNAVSPATYTAFAADTFEVANASGYTTGGVSVGAGTYTNAAGVQTFGVTDATWTAAGGTITARAAVLYDSTDASKRAVAYCLLDAAPADIVVPDTHDLVIVIGDLFTLGI